MATPVAGYARWFRESTPYISAHRGRTFVVLLGGDTVEHPNLVHIVHDLALLNVLGVRLVLVHGARQQIDAARTGALRFHRHRRITDAADIEVIHGVNGRIRATIEALFSTGVPGSPLRNSDLCVVSGNFVAARPIGVLDGVDHLFTGTTRSVHTGDILPLLDMGTIVLLSSVGYSPSGTAYNLAADELAADVALALGADKLIAFADDAHVTDAAGHAYSELTPAELDSLIDTTSMTAPQRARLTALLRASRGGIKRCHMVSHHEDGALLQELFTARGHGTQVSEETFQSIRPADAGDVAGIIELIRPLEAAGILIERSRDRLESEIEQFLVAEIDGIVVGCCALYPYGDVAELACVAVHPSYRNGLGGRLAAAAEKRARAMGIRTLFALTTQTRDWFIDQGFAPVSLDALPIPRQSLYNYQRNAHVLGKTLEPDDE